MKRVLVALALCAALPSFADSAPALSDAVTAKRPLEGEYMGLYLMGKKVGYIFTNVKLAPGKTDQAIAVNEFVFKANVGAKTAQRTLKETRTYEAKPNGKLLNFLVEQSGDGGDQVLEATSTPTGLRVLQKRPGLPNETKTLKATKETVEDADQARVALKRNAKVEGTVTDGADLEQYRVTTTLGETATRVFGGVSVKVRKVITLSDKENVPAEAWIDEQGRMVEINFGGTMKAVLEPEAQAKRLDTVEVFGLTRLVLPRALPEAVLKVPGSYSMVVSGLPEKFRKEGYRQHYEVVDKAHDTVNITFTAAPPKSVKAVRPVTDPNGGTNLKASIAVDHDSNEIKALSKKIVGDEKNAWEASKKISRWVFQNLDKDYGSSSDRASDVARRMKGDCTEHSLLTTALLRAAGIPARRVDGVVYLLQDDKVPAMYWHEWVEAYVGEWTQLDPTFGEDVASAAHFAVGEEGNAEITPLIGSLKVLKVN